MFLHFPLLLQRKDAKGKQTETPFEKGVCGLYQNRGHSRTKRRECFIPTQTYITTRLPNGGSFWTLACLPTYFTGVCLSLWYSLAHRPLVFLQRWSCGRDEGFSKLVTKPQKQKPPRSVRTECAQLGVSVRTNSECGEAFAPFCARMPHPFGEISKNPFRKRGSLSCFLLVPFLCRSKEKYTRAAFLCYLSFAEAKESRKIWSKEKNKNTKQ